HSPRDLLDTLGDGPPVLRPGLQGAENQQIERALQKVESHVVVGCLQQQYAPAFSKCQCLWHKAPPCASDRSSDALRKSPTMRAWQSRSCSSAFLPPPPRS